MCAKDDLRIKNADEYASALEILRQQRQPEAALVAGVVSYEISMFGHSPWAQGPVTPIPVTSLSDLTDEEILSLAPSGRLNYLQHHD